MCRQGVHWRFEVLDHNGFVALICESFVEAKEVEPADQVGVMFEHLHVDARVVIAPGEVNGCLE